MKLANVKLVVTDLDGTLLNSNHQVSTLFFELFKKLKKHNIIFVAASGRPLYGILEKLNTIKNEMIIVAENGGLIIKDNEILSSNPLKKENLTSIDKLLQTLPEANTVYCTKDKAYTSSSSEKLLALLDEYYQNFETVTNINDIKEPIYKIALYHETSSEKHLYPSLKHLEDNFKVKVSANHWVDISENNANKGNAIQLIQKQYNISKNETIVFGDYNNDIEMLNAAYFSYAMENAHPFVKETTRFITKSNNEYGVETILENLITAKENTTSTKQ